MRYLLSDYLDVVKDRFALTASAGAGEGAASVLAMEKTLYAHNKSSFNDKTAFSHLNKRMLVAKEQCCRTYKPGAKHHNP